MALAREDYTIPVAARPTGLKTWFESYRFGRIGPGIARRIREFLRQFSDPSQHKLWKRRFGLPLRNIVRLGRPLDVSIDDVVIRLIPDGAVAADIWAGIRFERHEISFILTALEPGMIFFDVGANSGLFAISAASKIGGRGVFAFEPCSKTVELLNCNLRLNGITEVTTVRAALGESIGEGMLQLNARGKDGLNTLGRPTHPASCVVGQEKVRVTTLDDFVKEHNVPRVDVMKVDIEGAELLAFRGARALLERSDAPLILYKGFGFRGRGFGYHPVEVLWFLESCGYSFLLFSSGTGAIAKLTPDYQYDSTVIAIKPGHSAYSKLLGARL